MEKINRDFFARKPEVVAKELLGKLLVRKTGSEIFVGRIVETEAYLGFGDNASHSNKGMTKRNEVMFGKAGVAYVYFTYGMHWLLNFITEEEEKPSGVLIRALEPICDSRLIIHDSLVSEFKKLASGPARLTKWMEIDGSLNREDITKSNKLFITDSFKECKSIKIKPNMIIARPRVGVDYAKEHKDLLLRFYIRDNKYISKI